MSAPVRLLSTLAVMGALRALMAQGAIPVEAEFAPTLALLERLRSGEAADVAVLTREGVDALAAEGVLDPASIADVALSRVGIAVPAGAPAPDIADVAALRATLRAARCVAYSRIGASGLFFAGLLETLGIAAEVNTRACIVPGGLTAEKLLDGIADIAVQQVSELMVVPGVQVIGPVPAGLQEPVLFTAARLAASRNPQADVLLGRLAGPWMAPLLRAAGLEPSAPPERA